MICTNCNASVVEGDTFCSGCGLELDWSKAGSRTQGRGFCSACGGALSPSDAFCGECGASVENESSTGQVASYREPAPSEVRESRLWPNTILGNLGYLLLLGTMGIVAFVQSEGDVLAPVIGIGILLVLLTIWRNIMISVFPRNGSWLNREVFWIIAFIMLGFFVAHFQIEIITSYQQFFFGYW